MAVGRSMPNRSRTATMKSLRTKTTRRRRAHRAGGTDETGDYLGKVAEPLAIFHVIPRPQVEGSLVLPQGSLAALGMI